MKLYKYTFGEWVNYGPAKDDADAFERRIGIDPQFHYVAVTIEEVKLEGYEITVQPTQTEGYVNMGSGKFMTAEHYIDQVKTMDKKELQNALMRKDIPFHHALGEDKLRELVVANIVA